MAEVMLLAPREEMIYLAHNILQEGQRRNVDMKVIRTEQAVSEARGAIGRGASVIIARGLQASLIRQYTDAPVVEIAATAQEMALLVMKAKQIVQKERPVIAAVGFQNMFCDMTYFDAIYDIQLRTYFARTGEELGAQADAALREGADLLIGGDTAVARAQAAGLPSLFLSTTEDSLRTALAMAERICCAVETERRSQAQIETLLDSSFNGVINLDCQGRISRMNPAMREILGSGWERPEGRLVTEAFPDMDQAQLRLVLAGKAESYACLLRAGGGSVVAFLTPVLVGQIAEGAILTCHRTGRRRSPMNALPSAAIQEPGLRARGRLDALRAESKPMRDCLKLAEWYAQARQPVLLFGETGTPCRFLAEGIHNGGGAAGGPFGAFSCACGQEQSQRLFGDKGLIRRLDGGSLYLEELQYLKLPAQAQLVQLLQNGLDGERAEPATPVRLRLLASVTCPPEALRRQTQEGGFREDLYYLLSGLTLPVPPLRDCPEDLARRISELFRECCERYSRYHVLTEGARARLGSYGWPGNLLQLESFLNRLVLTAERRSIDEVMAGRLLAQLYPEPERDAPAQRIVSREEERIREALARSGGSREQTARQLGISKATLWRKMKRYSIDAKSGS